MGLLHLTSIAFKKKCNAAVYVTLQPTLSTVRLSLRDPNRMGKTSDLKDYEDIRVGSVGNSEGRARSEERSLAVVVKREEG